MKINPAMIHEYRRYLKVEKQVINPYKDPIYEYKNLESETHKVDQLRKLI